jgi:hypothetical protein
MTRKLKVLGLALVAVFAMSALVASAASADTFTAESAPVDLTGAQTTTNEFSVAGATVKCPVARFTGTVATTSASSITVHPEYEGNESSSCEVSPIGSATISTTGCNYIISGTTTNGDAGVEVECSGTNEITVNGPCVIHIKAQKPTGGASFTNGTENGKGDVTVKATVTGIHAVVTDSFLCTIGGINPGTYTNGTYTGSVTVTGYKDGQAHTVANQVGISVDTP